MDGFHQNFNYFFDGLGLRRMYANRSEPMRLETQHGYGQISRCVPRQDMNIVLSDMVFHKKYELALRTDEPMIELNFCLSGTREIHTQDKTYRFEPGICTLQFIRHAEITFDFVRNEPYHMLGIGIPVSTFHHFMEDGEGHCALHFDDVMQEEMLKIFQEKMDPASLIMLNQLSADLCSKKLTNLKAESKVLELLNKAVSTFFSPKSESSFTVEDLHKLEQAAHIMTVQMAEPPSLPKLAKMIGMNEHKLKVSFKGRYGVTVFAYLKERRLEHALELLIMGELNVYETALAVGYSNPGHFAEIFKQRYGFAPKQVLKR